MNVLVIGSGGREHAIIKAIKKSKKLENIYIANGNYGIGLDANQVNLDLDNNQEIVDFCFKKEIELVIVGPENALIGGIGDELRKNNIMVLGPNEKAAQIEASKAYAKKIMEKYHIPTAYYEEFVDYQKALDYLKDKNTYPTVIKYDGLAAGKGVYIPKSFEEAKDVLYSILVKKELGNDSIIIEEFLDGDEFTILSLVNNDKVFPFQSARDFKRIFDNDEGLNTGGMGSICPYHNVNEDLYNQALTILKQSASAMVSENNAFNGVLYGGFINVNGVVKVIEFNARFGDPETQCVLNNLKSDLLENIIDLVNDKEVKLDFKNQVSCGVVLSAKGYPEAYEKNVDLSDYLSLNYDILHMSSKKIDEKIVSDGGRVLFVLASGKDSNEAFTKVYDELDKVKNHKLHFRTDLRNY